MREPNARTWVGTSGWVYEDWKGRFYPPGLARDHWLDYYVTRFAAVEINATFYGHFKDQTYRGWRDRAPAGFRYVLKVPRLITHRKHLLEVEADIREFWRSAELLGERLGMILLQVAPDMPHDPPRLARALAAFGDPRRVAVEFRREEWLAEETCALLREAGVAFCTADSPRTRLSDWVTSAAGYIRLHGRSRWYAYDYSPAELEEIAGVAQRMARNGAEDVYIFFNNDVSGFAPGNAQALQAMLAGRQPEPGN